MRVLVTGASGHVGSCLVRKLLSEGEDVAVLVRGQSSLHRLGSAVAHTRVLRGNLCAPDTMSRAVLEFRPDLVFHLAWQGVEKALRNDPTQVHGNLRGGIRLFEAAREAGCESWVGVGSQAEYGPAGVVLTEQTPTCPENLYGAAKLALGHITTSWAKAAGGMRAAWVRLLATYGPDDQESRFIPSAACSMIRGEMPVIESGRRKWDYLYVDDAAEALLRVGRCATATGPFVLSSGQAWTIRDIAEELRTIINPLLAPEYLDEGAGPDGPSLLGDPTRLQALTGWKPAVGMKEGLARTARWYQEKFQNEAGV